MFICQKSAAAYTTEKGFTKTTRNILKVMMVVEQAFRRVPRTPKHVPTVSAQLL